MVKSESIQVFDSQGEAYKRAFQIFLDHTDQKRNAKRFLQKLVDGLPNRNIFIDAGAGNGEVTKAFAGVFDRTIAIEPNPHLLTQLKQAIRKLKPLRRRFLLLIQRRKATSCSVHTRCITFLRRNGLPISNGSSRGCRRPA